MKKYSIYLHEEIIETLKCFGDLNEVINKLIETCIQDGSAFNEIFSSAPDRTGAKRVDVYIRYDIISQIVGFKIRPLIYWFIENEKYLEHDWKMITDPSKEKAIRLRKQIDKTLNEMFKLNHLLSGRISEIIDILEKIKYET